MSQREFVSRSDDYVNANALLQPYGESAARVSAAVSRGGVREEVCEQASENPSESRVAAKEPHDLADVELRCIEA